MNFGRLLKYKREELNLSLVQISNQTEINIFRLKAIESSAAARNLLAVEVALLAKAYKFSVDGLVDLWIKCKKFEEDSCESVPWRPKD